MNTERPVQTQAWKPQTLKERFRFWNTFRQIGKPGTSPSERKPIGKRAAAAMGVLPALLGVAAGACADDQGHETTTVITAPSTTSTTEAPTTTTEAPTTTQSTTTSTTEAPNTTLPAYITKPTGDIFINNNELLNLGLFELNNFNFPSSEFTFNGRIINLSEEPYENFQGEDTSVIVADVIVGIYDNESPIRIKVLIGRPGDLTDRIILSNRGSQSKINQLFPIDNINGPILDLAIQNNSQVGFLSFDTSLLTDTSQQGFQNCVDWLNTSAPEIDGLAFCQKQFEIDKYYSNNSQLKNLLEKDVQFRQERLPSDFMFSANTIIFFLP